MAEYTISKIELPNGDICNIKDTNTWRGIQDNLTSSTNTTESLSAKQGYLLANGSARDDTKLPYSGFAHYSNTNGNNNGKYYKISINSTLSWMLNFTIKLYHAYRAYDLQISGYQYASNYWYSPNAIILGASSTDTIKVLFGYDSANHLWIAIPASQYTGISVISMTNGFTQVAQTNLKNLFTIEMVEGEPTTKQTEITAYRPWYRDEIIPIANGGTNATTVADARTNLGLGTMATETAANYLKLSGGTMTGIFTAKGSQYDDSITSSTSHAINMNNSNIIGLNAIYTADASDGAAEGINFYRDATHFDTLWMSGGDLLFVPNRALGTNTTKANSQKVGRFTANPTTGQVVITDGTTGGMKSSGYTIAKSVPSNAVFTDTNTKVNYTLATTTKSFLMASSDEPTSTTTAREAKGDTGVYLTTTAGELSSVRHSFNINGNEKAYLNFNSADSSLDLIFI